MSTPFRRHVYILTVVFRMFFLMLWKHVVYFFNDFPRYTFKPLQGIIEHLTSSHVHISATLHDIITSLHL